MKPILFEIGNASVPAYPFMLSLAFIIGTLIAVAICKKQHISIYKIFGLIISIQISAFLGSRLLFVINNYSQFETHLLEAFSLRPGGFAFTGGLFLSIFAAIIYIKSTNLPSWKISDCVVPSLAVGIFLTKIGCFLGGCCFGIETSSFPGVRFPVDSLAAQQFGVRHPVHPTQLYEAFSGLIILAVVILFVRKHKKFKGQLFLAFMILYLIVRTLNEALRGDAVHNYIFNLSQTQFLNIILIFFAVVVYWLKLKAVKEETKKRQTNFPTYRVQKINQ
jgi:phosphatidylglycerol:prolipoprotein diacylglycerol transferase